MSLSPAASANGASSAWSSHGGHTRELEVNLQVIVTSWHRETQALARRGDNFLLYEKCFRHKERGATNNEALLHDEHANERCMTDRVPVVFTVRDVERANTSE